MKRFKKTLALLMATTCLMATVISPFFEFFPSDSGSGSASTYSYLDIMVEK